MWYVAASAMQNEIDKEPLVMTGSSYEQMTQHMPSGRSKSFDLSTIVSVSKGKDAQVTVVVKENVRQLTKRYTFHSQEDAARYYEYVEFSRACGTTLREIFEDIDKTRVGRITILSLRRKMEAEDISATDEELDRMLNLYVPRIGFGLIDLLLFM